MMVFLEISSGEIVVYTHEACATSISALVIVYAIYPLSGPPEATFIEA